VEEHVVGTRCVLYRRHARLLGTERVEAIPSGRSDDFNSARGKLLARGLVPTSPMIRRRRGGRPGEKNHQPEAPLDDCAVLRVYKGCRKENSERDSARLILVRFHEDTRIR